MDRSLKILLEERDKWTRKAIRNRQALVFDYSERHYGIFSMLATAEKIANTSPVTCDGIPDILIGRASH